MEPDQTDQLLDLQACLKDISQTRNFVQLTSVKIKVITIGRKHLRNIFSRDAALLSSINLPPSTTGSSLGDLLNQDWSLAAHIKAQSHLLSTRQC